MLAIPETGSPSSGSGQSPESSQKLGPSYLVQVFQGQHNLTPVHSHFSLLEVLALVEVSEHFTTAHIV